VFPIRHTMNVILQLVAALQEAIADSKSFSELEERVYRIVESYSNSLLAKALETLDAQLMCSRDKKRFELVNRKQRTVVTTVGEVTFWRRYYRDRQTGKGCYLLDEYLGLTPRQRVSPRLREKAVALAVEMPYHRVAKVLQEFVPSVSAMTVWQEVQQLGAAERQWAESWRKAVFEQGQTLLGQRRVDELHVEVDGMVVRARDPQGRRRHIEVKLAVAYEGKREVAKGRRELMGRRIAAGVSEGQEFWEQTVVQFGHIWDWSGVNGCWLGTDGAVWAKQGLNMLPGAKHRLDPYHLRKALLQALRPEDSAYREVCEGLESGDWERIDRVLTNVERRSRGPAKERVRQLRGYLHHNWDGIVTSGVAASLGTIEGQVFHHLARRMKRHGARWSATGADHLVRVMAVRANREAYHIADNGTKTQSEVRVPKQEFNSGNMVARKRQVAESWLQVHLPALDGPHASRPWIKYILRELVRSPFTVA
jgi:hypothetical protein